MCFHRVSHSYACAHTQTDGFLDASCFSVSQVQTEDDRYQSLSLWPEAVEFPA